MVKSVKRRNAMKNFFGINRTESEKNLSIDGAAFLTGKVSNLQKRQVEEFVERIEQLENKPALTIPMQIIRYFLIAGMLGAVTFLYHCLETSFQQTIQEEGYLPVLALASVSIYFFVFFSQNRPAQEIAAEFRALYLPNTGSSVEEESCRQLEIPKDAQQLDIIMTVYRIKRGKEVIDYYLNFPIWVYSKEKCLCLGNLQEEYQIPFSAIVHREWKQKPLWLPLWNKTVEKSQSYSIKGNDRKGYRISRYLQINIEKGEEQFMLLIPEYDGKQMEDYLSAIL